MRYKLIAITVFKFLNVYYVRFYFLSRIVDYIIYVLLFVFDVFNTNLLHLLHYT